MIIQINIIKLNFIKYINENNNENKNLLIITNNNNIHFNLGYYNNTELITNFNINLKRIENMNKSSDKQNQINDKLDTEENLHNVSNIKKFIIIKIIA